MDIHQDICCGVTPWEQKVTKEVQIHLDDLIPQGGVMHFKKGHVIFYEGHHTYGFYTLKKGEIALSRVGMEGKNEHLPISAGYRNGLFGLFHLLTNTPHCATATAKTDVEIFFVPKSVIIDFLKQKRFL
ncbi:MAG: hypothetical protein A2W61_06885 [Deltaproteobacteria bacterium RIFCSPLOWO2_01_44_7]|nr:MAG: hypothetical protein A2712_01145 [Deltaproteobacteria bacterium RIFCSPHIGHO2_01_FULL_43_49]OGQ15257.1 MAG: hypothetical protein A3D22_04330 [Deltaproteobacteria bacterium RIFCSPHIGHO2_02_FULL_44_53]OGQ27119.1 MAG: hypothetical protein A3D98_01735 [Deltaproteobacteria bacterium RIFCSPHIGHO2_12_FULL_44_21]OGQ31773.1 MAG: hypothetical protein A2979_05490 [Deltaproteobacteria bacterium RIFCSPLOWO2_01_FULL_45_74]OGQ42975.1 MAG: hypothetical protein A3I70_07795 [Deltaproteobacteria bacterium 